MTKGHRIALTAILKMNTARSSGKSVSGSGLPQCGTESVQLTHVVLIVL